MDHSATERKRTRDNSEEEDGDASDRPIHQPDAEGNALSAILKEHHARVRKRAQEMNSADEAWEENVQQQDALQRYANAMHKLATEHWSTPAHSKFDDRLSMVLEALRSYFVGVLHHAAPVDPSTETPPLTIKSFVQLPRCVSIVLKEARRDRFSHGLAISEAESESVAQTHFSSVLLGRSPALRVLDVGSCFNPLRGAHLPLYADGEDCKGSSIAMRVDAVDLCPIPDSGVRQCDWLKVQFGSDALELSSLPSGAPVRAVLPCSYDAVVFCLLLSYLPCSEMRYRAVLHAFCALRQGGLLVIVSTRTQCSRSAPWVDQWVTAIERIGFARVHKCVKSKLVGLSFRKLSDRSIDGKELDALCGSECAKQLTVTADLL